MIKDVIIDKFRKENLMAKKTWNSFIDAHKTGTCVVGACYAKTPPNRTLLDGRQLPTPYGVLDEALHKVLKHDWAIRKEGIGIQVVLANAADLQNFQKLFQLAPANTAGPIAPCSQAFQYVYDNSDYLRLATGLGYVAKK